ncbi:MAG: pyridoxine 5'-phosphate synthase [Rickettsiales bacterium]|nr:pyridoxine 5'-phosphate synthase [Rickettsiales bacterium]
MRLGVNIDHVATLRNARGILHPDPIRAALLAMEAGADGITAHLREDRRHIRDEDIHRLKIEVPLPLNMEMAATDEMCTIALEVLPNAVCIVPERREELTTEGGLNVAGQHKHLSPMIRKIRQAGIRVSLFIDPDHSQIEASRDVGADIVELHTGAYAHNPGPQALRTLAEAAKKADALGLECHAGHGLNYANVSPIAAIPELHELNIGHFLMGEALFVGMPEAIRTMRKLMDDARR